MNSEWEPVANNCGTGAGGFKSGNTCARGGERASPLARGKGKGHLPSRELDGKALREATVNDPTDVLARMVYADWLEEDGQEEIAAKQRKIVKVIEEALPTIKKYQEAYYVWREQTGTGLGSQYERNKAYGDIVRASEEYDDKVEYEIMNVLEEDEANDILGHISRWMSDELLKREKQTKKVDNQWHPVK